MRGRLVLILIVAFLVAQPAWADGIVVKENAYEIHFPDEIVFTLSAESEAQIEKVTLVYQALGDRTLVRADPEFTPGTQIQATYTLNLRQNYLPPGAEIEYRWRIEDAVGNRLETEPVTFTHTDSRFQWQEISANRITLLWYQGERDFAEALLEEAEAALDRLSEGAGIELRGQVKILIYADSYDLLGALEAGAAEWTGGVAFTRLGLILIGIGPGELDWGKRALAHELSHLVVHRITESTLAAFGLPSWLDEGLASYAEGEMRAEFVWALEEAVAGNYLIALRSLTGGFGADPETASLAYAESQSVVTFILDRYGPEKMAQLLSVFARGTQYDEALREVLGVDTEGLEGVWRESIGAEPPAVETVVLTPTAVGLSPTTAVPTPTKEAPGGSICSCPGTAALLVLPVLLYCRRIVKAA